VQLQNPHFLFQPPAASFLSRPPARASPSSHGAG
jgi:hypothetical protein